MRRWVPAVVGLVAAFWFLGRQRGPEPVVEVERTVEAPPVEPRVRREGVVERDAGDEALAEVFGGRLWADVVCTVVADDSVVEAKVEIMPEELFEGVDHNMAGARAPVVDGKMRFKVAGPAGALRWTVSGYEEAWSHWEGAEVGGEVGCTVELVPGHSNVVMGTVVDVDGEPIEGALVQGCLETVGTAPDGTYTLVSTATEPCRISATWTGMDEDGRMEALVSEASVEVDLSQGDAVADLVMIDMAAVREQMEAYIEEAELTAP